MSIQAVAWALEFQDLPIDRRSGEPSSSAAFVLIGLANHAGPGGTDSFPSVETLQRYTKLSERSVRNALRALEEHGTIRPTPSPLVRNATIHDTRKRPRSYDIVPLLQGGKVCDESPVRRGKVSDEFAPEPSLNLTNQLREPKDSSSQSSDGSPSQAQAVISDLPSQNLNGRQKISTLLEGGRVLTHRPRRSPAPDVPEPPPGLDEEELLDWIDDQVGGLAGHERNAAQSMIYYDVPPRKIVYTILKQREVGYA